jgi:Zn-finger protein
MTYKEWFESHASKHAAIMQKLTHMSDQEVIEYFRFDNMVIHEPNFCLLYAQNKKCHDVQELNCYWCACPYFRFNDQGLEIIEEKTLYSTCSIQSKDGAQFISEKSIHQDCTGCLVPHHEKTLKKEFNRDWRVVMWKVQNQ